MMMPRPLQLVLLVAVSSLAALLLPPLWWALLPGPGCMVIAASVMRARPKSGPH